MTPTEMNFDGTPLDPPEDQEPEAIEPDPEPTPEEEPEPEDRLSRVEQALSELVEWARSTPQVAASQAPQAPVKPRPNFGNNEIAALLYDRIEELDRKNEDRWEQARQAEQMQRQVAADFAKLEDMAKAHVRDRVKQGDPNVDHEAVMQKVTNMGVLRNPRVPLSEAIEDAYNAVAYKAAKDQSRNQGVRDARSPTAKVPNEYLPTPRPTQSREPVQSNGQPVDRVSKLKNDAENAIKAFSRLSPEEREQAWG